MHFLLAGEEVEPQALQQNRSTYPGGVPGSEGMWLTGAGGIKEGAGDSRVNTERDSCQIARRGQGRP